MSKPRAPGVTIRRKKAPPPSTPTGCRYVASPEHKTHPGPWGAPKWHRRDPDISACPTEITLEQAQAWLDAALAREFCWQDEAERAAGGRFPAYLVWFWGDGFFQAQRLERESRARGTCSYKGYPARDCEVSPVIAEAFRSRGLMTDERFKRWRRNYRQVHGAKGC